MKTAFLIIDPQNDFYDPAGALAVPGAPEDAQRLARIIKQKQATIDAVFVTLDSHHPFHIAHQCFWTDRNGSPPPLFTVITEADVASGQYRPVYRPLQEHAELYVSALKQGNAPPLCIWPEHCLIGSAGHAVYDPIFQAVHAWEKAKTGRTTTFIMKGSNPKTEHYSAFKAEVEDPADPASALNLPLLKKLQTFDRIYVSGQALSHCVARSVQDLIEHVPPEKITVFADTTSPVTGFEKDAETFTAEAKAAGVEFLQTDHGERLEI